MSYNFGVFNGFQWFFYSNQWEETWFLSFWCWWIDMFLSELPKQFVSNSVDDFFSSFFHLWSRIIIKLGTLLLYNIFFLIILTFKSSKSVKNWQSYATFFFASKILAQYVNNVTHDANMTRSEFFWRLLNQNISTSVNTISEITLGEL